MTNPGGPRFNVLQAVQLVRGSAGSGGNEVPWICRPQATWVSGICGSEGLQRECVVVDRGVSQDGATSWEMMGSCRVTCKETQPALGSSEQASRGSARSLCQRLHFPETTSPF